MRKSTALAMALAVSAAGMWAGSARAATWTGAATGGTWTDTTWSFETGEDANANLYPDQTTDNIFSSVGGTGTGSNVNIKVGSSPTVGNLTV